MSLFVGGQFQLEGKPACRQVAVWFKITGEWTCLLNRFEVFKEISTVYMGDNGHIYVAGEVHNDYMKTVASQQQMHIPAANRHHIAVADLSEYRHNALFQIDRYKRSQKKKETPHKGQPSKGDDDDSHTSGGGDSNKNKHKGDDDSSSSHKHRKMYSSSPHDNGNVHVARDNDDAGTGFSGNQWRADWKWLPKFHGTDGHITRLMLGHQQLEGYLVVAGDFSEYNSVLFWPAHAAERDSHHHHRHRSLGSTSYNNDDTSTSSSNDDEKSNDDKDSSKSNPPSDLIKQLLMSNQTVNGTINSMAQIYVPVELSIKVDNSGNNATEEIEDYISLVVLLGLFIGGALGVFLANYYYKSSWAYEPVDNGNDDHPSNFNLSLKMLGRGDESKLGFKNIFNEAMKARHLPTHETLLLINPTEIILSRIIGEGSFGRVWSGQYHNNKVAVKEFVFAQAAVAGESLQKNRIIEEIVGEAGIMACLRHPKIIQIYGCSLTMQAIWITSELCGLGSLRMVLNNEKFMQKMDFLSELSICLDIADGCHYLHTRSPPIIHRDLKSHNVFIQEQSRGHYVAKIGDWGSARALALADKSTKNMTKGIGTACWLAPEVINHGHASKSSDVYSFGIVLWEIMTRKEVYPGLSAEQIIAKVANSNLRPALPPNLPLSDIMGMCWKQNSEERPTFHQILNTLSKLYSVVKKNPSASRSKNIVGSSSGSSSSSSSNVYHKSKYFSNTSDSNDDDDHGSGHGSGNAYSNDSSDGTKGVEMSAYIDNQPSSRNMNSNRRENRDNTPIRRPLSVPIGDESSSLLVNKNSSYDNTKNHNGSNGSNGNGNSYGGTTEYGNSAKEASAAPSTSSAIDNGNDDSSTVYSDGNMAISTPSTEAGEGISIQRLEMEREAMTPIQDPMYAARFKRKDEQP
jgi:hypothetical protein